MDFDLDSRFRFQVWISGLDFRFGFQVWISGLDYRFRFQVWISGLDFRFGSDVGDLAGWSLGNCWAELGEPMEATRSTLH